MKMLHKCGYYILVNFCEFAQVARYSATTVLCPRLPAFPEAHFIGIGRSVRFWDSCLGPDKGTNVECS